MGFQSLVEGFVVLNFQHLRSYFVNACLFLYARQKTGRIMELPYPSVHNCCERDILKTACRIDFTF